MSTTCFCVEESLDDLKVTISVPKDHGDKLES